MFTGKLLPSFFMREFCPAIKLQSFPIVRMQCPDQLILGTDNTYFPQVRIRVQHTFYPASA